MAIMSMSKPVKYEFQTVITVDTQKSEIRFDTMSSGNVDTLATETKKCRIKFLNEDFFKTFGELVSEFAAAHPEAQDAGVTVVLPDTAVSTDSLNIPTLKKKKTDESLDIALKDLYRNYDELKINRFLSFQNKQITFYSVTMMRNYIINGITDACTECKMAPQEITFSASSAVNAVGTIMPRIKSSSYLFMDIKEDYTRFSLVSKGRSFGYYSLPFGYSIFEHNRLAAEDMLFDHSVADLLVLNAKEKAKAKQLTMMQDDAAAQAGKDIAAEAEENEMEEEEIEEQDIFTAGTADGTVQTIKTLPKKQPRKLPKFMLREIPHTDEGYAYENFRLFEKWALNLIQSNSKVMFQDKPEAVYVNMPSEYNYILEVVNEEKKENGVPFMPLEVKGVSDKIINNLESYGGFFACQMNPSNNF